MKGFSELNLEELAGRLSPILNPIITRRLMELHEQHRWIPVEERLPTDEDGEPFMGRVLWMWGVGYVEAKSWNNMPQKATHWKHIDKPEGV